MHVGIVFPILKQILFLENLTRMFFKALNYEKVVYIKKTQRKLKGKATPLNPWHRLWTPEGFCLFQTCQVTRSGCIRLGVRVYCSVSKLDCYWILTRSFLCMPLLLAENDTQCIQIRKFSALKEFLPRFSMSLVLKACHLQEGQNKSPYHF